MRPIREPVFNAPAAVVLMLGALVAVHLGRLLLSDDADVELLLRFAFFPARYDDASPYAALMRGGEGAKAWTFVTYALLHGGLVHLAVNGVGLLAFGSALAWRFGAARFVVFSALTAAAGAAVHLALHLGEPVPVVGASAAISGHMAAAMRFMFESGGPLGAFRRAGRAAFAVPAEPLSRALRRPPVLIFLAAWFGTNLVFGLLGGAPGDEGAGVAWEAHIGGFLAGLALFPLLDPVRRTPVSTNGPPPIDLPPGAHPPHDDGSGAAGRP